MSITTSSIIHSCQVEQHMQIFAVADCTHTLASSVAADSWQVQWLVLGTVDGGTVFA
jgi:hypothetical protein